MKNLKILFVLLIITACMGIGYADIPKIINYQGMLKDNGVPVTGSKNMTFKLYDALSGGNVIWTNNAGSITIVDGLYTYKIGSDAGSPDFSTLDWSGISSVYLEVVVEGSAISPRIQLVSVPFAMTVADNAISTSKLSNNAVTSSKISDNAVTTGKIANNAVTSNQISANTIPSSKLTPSAILSLDPIPALYSSGITNTVQVVREYQFTADNEIDAKNNYGCTTTGTKTITSLPSNTIAMNVFVYVHRLSNYANLTIKRQSGDTNYYETICAVPASGQFGRACQIFWVPTNGNQFYISAINGTVHEFKILGYKVKE